MTKPLVTVYTVCRNHEKYIHAAIKSVLKQTYKNWEYFIVDDCSDDNSLKIAKELAKGCNVHLRSNKSRKGLIANANLIIKEARGKYIIRLDSDDILTLTALLQMVTIAEEENLDAVYCDLNLFDENHKPLHVAMLGPEDIHIYPKLPMTGAGILVRTDFLKKINGYPETIKRQDGYWLAVNLHKHGKYSRIRMPLYYYRRTANSLSSDRELVDESIMKIRDMMAETVLTRSS